MRHRPLDFTMVSPDRSRYEAMFIDDDEMTSQPQIFETAVTENSGLKYKIQMRCVHGVWQQRHIWYPPTPHVTEETAQEWIRSVQTGPGTNFQEAH